MGTCLGCPAVCGHLPGVTAYTWTDACNRLDKLPESPAERGLGKPRAWSPLYLGEQAPGGGNLTRLCRGVFISGWGVKPWLLAARAAQRSLVQIWHPLCCGVWHISPPGRQARVQHRVGTTRSEALVSRVGNGVKGNEGGREGPQASWQHESAGHTHRETRALCLPWAHP